MATKKLKGLGRGLEALLGPTFNGPVNSNLPSNFSSSLSYDTNDVYLNLVLNFAVPGGLGANQQNVGKWGKGPGN